jgi:nucleotide-binding universal stress UspA family protein
MFSLAKILAPVDFSELSPGAARYAGILAGHFHSELALLHVLDSGVYELSDREATDPSIRKLSESWRFRTEGQLANFMPGAFPNLPVRRIVSCGHPAEEIVRFVHSEGTSLVVIPTRGFEPFRRYLLGPVASKVLHDADCPVLTSPHSQEGFPELNGFRKILCAVDFCPQSLNTLAWASQLAGEFQAQLTIAHITPSTEGGVGEYFNPERRGIWAMESRHR